MNDDQFREVIQSHSDRVAAAVRKAQAPKPFSVLPKDADLRGVVRDRTVPFAVVRTTKERTDLIALFHSPIEAQSYADHMNQVVEELPAR